jgi:hypothetical protein
LLICGGLLIRLRDAAASQPALGFSVQRNFDQQFRPLGVILYLTDKTRD